MDSHKKISTNFTKFTSGVLGNYKSCTVTEIFAWHKKRKTNIKIIYALVNFEVAEIALKKDKINREPIILTQAASGYRFGIQEYSCSIYEAERLFNEILKENRWNHCLGKWNLCPSKFVQVDPNNEVILNHVLKNNFFNGSYIEEFFDFGKEWFNFLLDDQKVLDELSSKIYEFIPIDLAVVPDRLGNIIFQFPVSVSNFDICAYKNGDVVVHMDTFIPNIVAVITPITIDEYGVSGGYNLKPLNDKNTSIFCGEIDKIAPILYDMKNEVIVHATSEAYFIRSVDIVTHAIGNKTITKSFISADTKMVTQCHVNMPLTSIMQIGGENTHDNTILSWIKKREYRANQQKLMEEYKFKQFFQDQRQEALEFIRGIINRYGQKEIYLWDPYCNTSDISSTIFHTSHYNPVIKIIADYHLIRGNGEKKGHSKKELQQEFNNWKLEQQANLKIIAYDTEQYLKIEYRVRFNQPLKFHDRFIICRDNNGIYRAWQIGTSINSLGCHHHIISELQDPKNILDSFNQFWGPLESSSDCLVWKI